MPASGTFGSGQEYSEFVDLNQLGAVVTKGVSLTPWEGNPAPRIMETSSGMINDVLEFIMAGATGIAIGTANFNNPFVMPEIISKLTEYMKENNIEILDEIRGIVG